MGIQAPNYTQTPNELFDRLLPHLGEAELKVLLVIFRKTFGWHKTRDRISASQLSELTGLKEDTVVKAARSLHSKGIIKREVVGPAGKQETFYDLIVTENSNNSYPPVQQGIPPLTPPAQTGTQKKALTSSSLCKEKKQQQASRPNPMTVRATPVVVASSNKIKIYDCLKDLPLNDVEKTNICKNHAEEKVLSAVKNALARKTPARSLGALIFWLASQSIEEKPTQEETASKNHQHAKEIEKHIVKNKNTQMEVLSKEVEFNFPTAQKASVGLPYTDPMFKKKLQEYLVKFNIEIKHPLKSNP